MSQANIVITIDRPITTIEIIKITHIGTSLSSSSIITLLRLHEYDMTLMQNLFVHNNLYIYITYT